MRWLLSPARYAIERGDWKAAADLQVRPSPLANVQAITYFARALGAARSGNPEAAKIDIAKLAELRDELRDAQDGYWSEQVDIQQQVATRLGPLRRGQARRSAERDEAPLPMPRTRPEKHPVTPVCPSPLANSTASCCLTAAMPRKRSSRSRSDTQEGAEPVRRLCGRSDIGRKDGKQGQGQCILREVCRVCRWRR